MNDVGQHLLSGAVSGFASSICLQPLDLLKTRLQQGDGTMHGPRPAGTIVSIARDIVKSEGVLGLWRGTSPTLLRNVPGVALYFTGLNYTRTLLASTRYFALPTPATERTHSGSVLPKLNKQGNLLAGATTRVAIGALLNPFAVLKARYESDLYAYTSVFRALGSLIRAGPSELFRGILAASLRDAPYAGLFVLFYEQIKAEVASVVSPTSSAYSTGIHSFSAGAAGMIASLATHPFDVIKTKMQVRTEDRYHGLLRTVTTIYRQRGIPGFYDGAVLRILRKLPNSAIAWATYEGVLMFMRTSQR
ncbi:mitochondrial carrier [Laetiporus sulphureus 93-53]|uniref:Mitochondrial glycine transporter n=1 Tax=Laetiporus sulphureus 93-53 TaxID=1314785 RepID=A0A165IJI8_9APHY|nr:mitochondrial carrier [Laetiporus sulphureus 93-53]KZT13167.1 mitochondrial carrier [Laetiporus sulphureus 93-53]